MISTVYWNLHKDCWSVVEGGKTHHYDQLSLIAPRTHFIPKKYEISMQLQRRHVCATMKGQRTEFTPIEGRAFSYNPFKSKDFYYMDTGETFSGTFTRASFWTQAGKPRTAIE